MGLLFANGWTRKDTQILDYCTFNVGDNYQNYDGPRLEQDQSHAMRLDVTDTASFGFRGMMYAGASWANPVYVLYWRNGTTTLGTLRWLPVGPGWSTFDVYVGSSTFIARATPIHWQWKLGWAVYDTSQYAELGLYVLIDDTVGRVKLWINRHLVIDFTGDTKPDANTQLNNFYSSTGSGSDFFWDDWVITTGEPPLGCRVKHLVPSGDGATTDWSAVPVGTHYSVLDETPPSQTDNVYTDTENLYDLYTLEDLPAAAKSVVGVMWSAGVRAVGPISVKVHSAFRSGGVDYHEATGVPVGYSRFITRKCYDVNPVSGSPWSISDLNSIEAGVWSGAS